ncbi:MAG: hypothetical protein HQL78_05590 [Magnetococcales bacterium]|nr:hypothetical protein [Magnetococcales bacterium]
MTTRNNFIFFLSLFVLFSQKTYAADWIIKGIYHINEVTPQQDPNPNIRGMGKILQGDETSSVLLKKPCTTESQIKTFSNFFKNVDVYVTLYNDGYILARRDRQDYKKCLDFDQARTLTHQGITNSVNSSVKEHEAQDINDHVAPMQEPSERGIVVGDEMQSQRHLDDIRKNLMERFGIQNNDVPKNSDVPQSNIVIVEKKSEYIQTVENNKSNIFNSSSMPLSLIIAWAFFSGFVSEHTRHAVNFRGSSQTFKQFLILSSSVGFLVSFTLTAYYFMHVAWYYSIFLYVVVSVASGIIFVALSLILSKTLGHLGQVIISFAAFIGWPASAIWVFSIISNINH